MRAFIFPGQGSHSVGMGAALAAASPVAREVFGEVDEALGQNLFRLMSEGPESETPAHEASESTPPTGSDKPDGLAVVIGMKPKKPGMSDKVPGCPDCADGTPHEHVK